MGLLLVACCFTGSCEGQRGAPRRKLSRDVLRRRALKASTSVFPADSGDTIGNDASADAEVVENDTTTSSIDDEEAKDKKENDTESGDDIEINSMDTGKDGSGDTAVSGDEAVNPESSIDGTMMTSVSDSGDELASRPASSADLPSSATKQSPSSADMPQSSAGAKKAAKKVVSKSKKATKLNKGASSAKKATKKAVKGKKAVGSETKVAQKLSAAQNEPSNMDMAASNNGPSSGFTAISKEATSSIDVAESNDGPSSGDTGEDVASGDELPVAPTESPVIAGPPTNAPVEEVGTDAPVETIVTNAPTTSSTPQAIVTTEEPSAVVSIAITETPTVAMTIAETEAPTAKMTMVETEAPTPAATDAITEVPTTTPVVETSLPTVIVTEVATSSPTAPEEVVVTDAPTVVDGAGTDGNPTDGEGETGGEVTDPPIIETSSPTSSPTPLGCPTVVEFTGEFEFGFVFADRDPTDEEITRYLPYLCAPSLLPLLPIYLLTLFSSNHSVKSLGLVTLDYFEDLFQEEFGDSILVEEILGSIVSSDFDFGPPPAFFMTVEAIVPFSECAPPIEEVDDLLTFDDEDYETYLTQYVFPMDPSQQHIFVLASRVDFEGTAAYVEA